jgi:Na+/melibiose symporter-like transporter
MGIRIAVGPIPAALLCIGILFAALYPLNRQQHSDLRAELEARRAKSQGAPVS